MANGSAAVRLGLGSGGGMSVTTCGGGEAEDEGGTGIDGGASRAGPFGLRSGSGTTEVAAAKSVCGVTVCTGVSAGGVVATEDEGLRSGMGRASAGVAVGFRSGVATVPVSIVASDAGEGEGSGVGGVSCAAACVGSVSCVAAGAGSATGAAGVVALNGLRSGREGGTCALAARAGFADGERGDFATATAEATHAKQANSKMCARMRFISSIGFRLRSCSQDVPRAGEPRR